MTDDNSTPKQSDKTRFLPQHIEYLKARKIPVDYAERAGVVSLEVPSKLLAAALRRKFPRLAVYPSTGLLTPYLVPALDGIARSRVRWDSTCYHKGTPGADEQAVDIPRYSAQQDVPVVPYFPPDVYIEGIVDNPSVPLYITGRL